MGDYPIFIVNQFSHGLILALEDVNITKKNVCNLYLKIDILVHGPILALEDVNISFSLSLSHSHTLDTRRSLK